MAPQQRTADDDATDRGLSLLDVLPPGALVEVMRVIGFPSRHIAASVCREFRDAAGDATFTTRVRHGQSIGDACDEAAPGDTVVVPAGYYLETVVLPDKPLKIVGARADDIFGGSRPGVVVESLGGVVIDATRTTRVHLENLVLRSRGVKRDARNASAVAVAAGAGASLLRMERCQVRGVTGLTLPAAAGPAARLVCVGCEIRGVGVRPTGFEAAASHGGGGHNHHHHGGGGGGGEGKCSYEGGGGGGGPTVTAAVQVEAGRCQLRGCVITDNQGFGVLVGSQGYVEIEHCDVSFNRESGLWWDS